MSNLINRRSFVKNSAIAGAALGFSPDTIKAYASAKKSVVRVGMIGVGLRGQSHLELFLRRDDTEIIAMADPDKDMMADAQKFQGLKSAAPSSCRNAGMW